MALVQPGSLAGQLLLAETELLDPNFKETLVLLVQHDQEGALGFVVNRALDLNLGESTSSDLPANLAAFPLNIGGPVDREFLLVVHNGFPGDERSDAAVVLANGTLVFEPDYRLVSTTLERYGSLLDPSTFTIRFFAGYAGWGAGQLEAELAEGAWAVLPASPDLVFAHPGREAWLEGLRRLGGIHWAYAEGGYKPSLN